MLVKEDTVVLCVLLLLVLCGQVGVVIVCCWEDEDLPTEGELQRLMGGRATHLESQFRLTYKMILSLFRVDDLSVRRRASAPSERHCSHTHRTL